MKKQIKQAFTIISTAWQRNLTYRFTVLMYRIGETIELLVLILMWASIYSDGGIIKGFTLNEMITYILIGNLCSVATRNFLASHISREINQGKLSMFIVKPISYIKFIFLNELGRSFLAIAMSVASQIIVIILFLSKFIVNTDPDYIILMILMIFLAFIIELLIGFIVGTIAFWTDEVEGIQSTVERIKKFFSGGFFPITLLPTVFITISSYLPFQYSFFAPASLYLKKIDLHQGVKGIVIQIIWIILLSIILSFIWKRGLKKYEAVGS